MMYDIAQVILAWTKSLHQRFLNEGTLYTTNSWAPEPAGLNLIFKETKQNGQIRDDSYNLEKYEMGLASNGLAVCS